MVQRLGVVSLLDGVSDDPLDVGLGLSMLLAPDGLGTSPWSAILIRRPRREVVDSPGGRHHGHDPDGFMLPIACMVPIV